MLVSDAVRLGMVEDGWYDLDAEGLYRARVEDGKVRNCVKPDHNASPVPAAPYARHADGWVNVQGSCTLADLASGRVRVM